MMKKAEMQAHAVYYENCVATAETAVVNRDFFGAINAAVSAFDYVDGFIQYVTKCQEQQLGTVTAVKLVLHHAPAVLDSRSLDAVENLSRTCRRVDKTIPGGLTNHLASARQRLSCHHRLWSHLERVGECRLEQLYNAFAEDVENARAALRTWEDMRVVSSTGEGRSCRVSLVTRLGKVAWAKCPACGETVQAPKEMLLEPISCAACGSSHEFVFLDQSTLR